jgi:tetratricopeptide (TPR) repeat protein
MATLSTIQKEAEGDAYLANTLGNAYRSSGKLDQAEAWFRGALAVDAKNVDAHLYLGMTLEEKGDLQGGLAELENAHKADATREDVSIQLAVAYERDKRPEAAEKLYAAMIDDTAGKTPTIAARAAAGRFYARRGDAARAGKLGESILAEDARHPAGLFLRGIGLLATGRIPEAQADFEAAANIDPQAQYAEALGRTLEAQNQLDEAIKHYSDAIERDKLYQQPLLDRARVYQVRRQWNESLADLAAAKKLDDRVADIFVMEGNAFYEMGKKKDALRPYQQAVNLDGKNAEAWFKLGRTHYESDNPREAVADLNRAVELGKEGASWLPDAYMALGYANKATGARGEMCRAFGKYLEVAPATAPKSDVKQLLLGCP